MVSADSSGDGEESFLEFATGEELGNPRRYPNWPIPVVITITPYAKEISNTMEKNSASAGPKRAMSRGLYCTSRIL
ncbi:hypothetical protein H109_05684, partial [Trichophyton interdigitale MR816]